RGGVGEGVGVGAGGRGWAVGAEPEQHQQAGARGGDDQHLPLLLLLARCGGWLGHQTPALWPRVFVTSRRALPISRPLVMFASLLTNISPGSLCVAKIWTGASGPVMMPARDVPDRRRLSRVIMLAVICRETSRPMCWISGSRMRPSSRR